MNENNKLDELLELRCEKTILKLLNNELWQEYLIRLKGKNIPSKDKRLKRYVQTLVIGRSWSISSSGEKTSDESYISFINDAIDIIRGKYKKSEGLVATVYSIGHVKEILKYEPNLHSRFINDEGFTYFELWL